MNLKEPLREPLRVLVVFRDFLLRDLILLILNRIEGITVVYACQIQAYSRDVILEHQPDVVIADRMPANLMMELFEAATLNGKRIRVVTVSLAQEDLYVIEVEGHHQVDINDFVDAVLGRNQQTVGQGREESR